LSSEGAGDRPGESKNEPKQTNQTASPGVFCLAKQQQQNFQPWFFQDAGQRLHPLWSSLPASAFSGHYTAPMEFAKIVLVCIFASIVYGIAHDQVTARICVQYFTVFHPPSS
jgi:hypothetical protein